MTAIAASAPQLHRINCTFIEPSCHPAVVCAIVGGYCEHIENISVGDSTIHTWHDAQAADILNAYQSAVTAARRVGDFKPFTRLRYLSMDMCWCTPPSVWHAALSLLKHASRLNGIGDLVSNDPLMVAAFAYLPCLTSLGGGCLWPELFATFMEQRCERTGDYRYVACHELCGEASSGYHTQGTGFAVVEGAVEGGTGQEAVRLRPAGGLFTAFQRSLSDQQQAILQRWASGDFRAGDEQLRGVASSVEPCEEDAVDAAGRRSCPHAHLFHARYEPTQQDTDETNEEF